MSANEAELPKMGTLAERWARAGRMKKLLPELGEEVTVRRMQKEALLVSPRLPGSITAKVAAYFREMEESGHVADGAVKDVKLTEVPIEQLMRMPHVVNAVLIHTLEDPRAVVEGADLSKNEINVTDIPDADRSFLFAGAISDWPEIPVLTEGGAVKLEGLASFPDRGEGVESSDGGEGLQRATEQNAGDSGK